MRHILIPRYTGQPAARTPLAPLMPLYLVVFVGFIGYSLMVALFVQMLLEPHTHLVPPSATPADRTTLLGVLLALYPLGQFFGTPVLSAFSDRFGRKPVLLASLWATTACYGAVALAIHIESLPLLIVSLVACGLAESNLAIVQSALADVSAPEDRGRLFGYVFIAVRIGYVTGPLFGQVAVARHEYALPFWGVMALHAVVTLWTHAHFRETHPPQPGAPVRTAQAFTSLFTVFTDRPVRMLYLVHFLLYLAIFGYTRAILMYMVDRWHMGGSEISAFYAYFAAASLLANLAVMPLLSPRMGMKPLSIASAALGGLTTLGVALAPSPFWFWALIGPSICMLSVCLTASGALLSDSVSPERQGTVMGNDQALQVAAESAGAAGAGVLAGVFVRLPLLTFGAMTLLGALLMVSFRVPAPGGPQKTER